MKPATVAELSRLRDAAWGEHQVRCTAGIPYSGAETVEDLEERINGLDPHAAGTAQPTS